MGVLKRVVVLTSQHGKASFESAKSMAANRGVRPLLSCAPIAMTSFSRGAHSQDITKNMQFISQDKVPLKADPKTLKLERSGERPLCVMINWLLARQKHVRKYAAIYLEQGFDVLSVSCTPWQLMWPTKGSQLVAADLLKFMYANENFPMMTVHGFSVGGYIWGEVCMHALNNKSKYQPVLDRVGAQVWDSAADISELAIGVPAAVFPKNKVMQKTITTYLEYHLKHFHEEATVHYMRSSQMFHLNPCRAPALFLLSKSDPVGSEVSNRRVHDSWVSLGIKTTWKCWDRSPHVQHLTKHKDEYIAAVLAHLEASGQASRSCKQAINA